MKNVFLPKTSFQLRSSNEKEKCILSFWKEINLYKLQRESRKGSKLFILHDGPPFSNGHTHLGHFLNKTLKDFVNKSKFMLGYDFCFMPGWDCHGLPIESKIEEQLKQEKKNIKEFSIVEFRQKCRDYANHWAKIQSEEFQIYGVTADWEHPYKTMDNAFESTIVETFFKLLRDGYVYRGLRPVMWSVFEETALAEAEIEYKNIVSKSVYVKFPIKKCANKDLLDTSIVIWTTTPWTLPANRAVCFNNNEEYCLLQKEQEKIILAEKLKHIFPDFTYIKKIDNADLANIILHHPITGYDFEIPLLHGDHVLMDIGTGFVHTAPSHGIDDFNIGKKYNLDIPEIVNNNGTYSDDTPIFAGIHIFKVYPEIEKELIKNNNLLKSDDYEHSYPHSWRSKKPIIYKVTPQWFINLDGNLDLRNNILDAIKTVKWHPDSSINRISNMVKNRPDWCISRQRTWGVPLCILINKESGEILKDESIHNKITSLIAQHTSDIWFSEDIWEAIGLSKDEWIKIDDIIDVWFESGTTSIAVLQEKDNSSILKQITPTKWPADLYLEGSDQHRGWFNSSISISTAIFKQSPYREILTHGHILYGTEKMSKSQGNVVAPLALLKTNTVDELRLWIALSDYENDIKFDMETLSHVKDISKRFRNTLRYLLGGLHEFSDTEYIAVEEMPSLEKWIHSRIYSIHNQIKGYLEEYKFKNVVQLLHNFCSLELSSFYFDIRKDVLYCDGIDSIRRRAIRTTFINIFIYLSHWLSIFTCYSSEEAFQEFCTILDNLQNIPDDIKHFLHCKGNSIQTSIFIDPLDSWNDKELENIMENIKHIRSNVTEAIEKLRSNKQINSSLQAYIECIIPQDTILLTDIDLADICIVSKADIKYEDCNETTVNVHNAQGIKCKRCWKILEEVDTTTELCIRCSAV